MIDDMRSVRSLAAVLVVLVFGAGCAGEVVELDENAVRAGQESNTATGPVEADDPYGACERDTSDPNRPFHYVCTAGGGDCTGWGSGTAVCSAVTYQCDYDQVFHQVCDHPCQTAEDCPVPKTGNAHAICQPEVHACQLTCDESTTCPDGYVCTPTADWGLSSGGVPIPAPFMCMQTLVIQGP